METVLKISLCSTSVEYSKVVGTKASFRKWQVAITTSQNFSTTRTLSDPFDGDGGNNEEEVRWYINDFARNDPFSITRAERVQALLSRSRMDMMEALDLVSLVRKAEKLHENTKFGRVIIEIRDCPEMSKNENDTIHRLPWELLGDPEAWGDIVSCNIIVTRIYGQKETFTAIGNGPSTATAKNPTVFRILLVTARDTAIDPTRGSDISPTLIQHVFLELNRRFRAQYREERIQLEVVRPSTTSALSEHLESGQPFDVIHFDVHGTVGKGEKSGMAKTSRLHLSNPEREGLVGIKTPVVAEIVQRAGITCVVLNTCESARADGLDAANMAKVFLNHGLRDVLAIPYKMSSCAAEKFFPVFYEELLIRRASLGAAASAGRAALRKSALQDTRFGLKREVLQSFIPVHYSSGETSLLGERNTADHGEVELRLDTEQPGKKECLIGRDFDLLRLERMMAIEPFIFLYGDAGVGKTAFLGAACQVWLETSWLDTAIHVDATLGDMAGALIDKVSTQLSISKENILKKNWAQLISALQNRRLVVIVEHQEHIESSSFLIPRNSEEHDAAVGLLEKLIELAYSETYSCFVIFSQRHPPSYESFFSERLDIEFPLVPSFCLKGLRLPDANILTHQILEADGITTYSWSQPQMEQLDLVLGALDGNPSAIKILLPLVKSQELDLGSFHNFLLSGLHTVPQNLLRQTDCNLFRELDEFFRVFNATSILACLVLLGQFWVCLPNPGMLSDNANETIGLSEEMFDFAIKSALDFGWILPRNQGWYVNPLFTIYIHCVGLWEDFHSGESNWQSPCLQAGAIPREELAKTLKLLGTSRSAPQSEHLSKMTFLMLSNHSALAPDWEKYYGGDGIDLKDIGDLVCRETSNFACAVRNCLWSPGLYRPDEWPWEFLFGVFSLLFNLGHTIELKTMAVSLEGLLSQTPNFLARNNEFLTPETRNAALHLVFLVSASYLAVIGVKDSEKRAVNLLSVGFQMLEASEQEYGPVSDLLGIYALTSGYSQATVLSIQQEDETQVSHYWQKFQKVVARLEQPVEKSISSTALIDEEALSFIISICTYLKDWLSRQVKVFFAQRGHALDVPQTPLVAIDPFHLLTTGVTNQLNITGMDKSVVVAKLRQDLIDQVRRDSSAEYQLNELERTREAGHLQGAIKCHQNLYQMALECGNFKDADEHKKAINSLEGLDPELKMPAALMVSTPLYRDKIMDDFLAAVNRHFADRIDYFLPEVVYDWYLSLGYVTFDGPWDLAFTAELCDAGVELFFTVLALDDSIGKEDWARIIDARRRQEEILETSAGSVFRELMSDKFPQKFKRKHNQAVEKAKQILAQ